MDEAEWLACTAPKWMLEFLKGKASDRKLRLFAVACCRQVWWQLTDEWSRRAAEVAERYADGKATWEDVRKADNESLVARDAGPDEAAPWYSWDADAAANFASVQTCRFDAHRESDVRDRAGVLRDIFGNPFRPIVFDIAWRTPTVIALATAAYEERHLPAGTFDMQRLAILADALEDAGCTNDQLVAHLREPSLHVRGCWVVDLLLGKE
jgi:hypothetical protein